MKRKIKLTEQDIVRMVKRAVNEVKINEMDWRTYKNAEKESNKREREYDKKISRLRDKSNRDINYEKNQDKYEKQIDDLKKKREKEFKRGYKFHDYSDELMNKKHNFDRKSKYGTMRQYASSNSGGITLNKIFKGNNGIQTIEREFKHILPSKKAKNSIEHRQFGNTFKYDYDNPPAPFSDKSDKSADLFGDSSNLEKEIIGYNTGRDQYEPGKGWPEYNESFNRRVKKSIRESLERMNEGYKYPTGTINGIPAIKVGDDQNGFTILYTNNPKVKEMFKCKKYKNGWKFVDKNNDFQIDEPGKMSFYTHQHNGIPCIREPKLDIKGNPMFFSQDERAKGLGGRNTNRGRHFQSYLATRRHD